MRESSCVLWAKSSPRHALWRHLLDAAAVALELPFPLAQDGWTPAQLAFIVGLHDIGKADPCFQHQAPDLSAELERAGFPRTGDAPCRHEGLSAAFAMRRVRDLGATDRVATALAHALTAHHGRWEGHQRPTHDAYHTARDDLASMLERSLAVAELPSTAPANMSAFALRVAGHVVLSDWIASNEALHDRASIAGIAEPGPYLAAARAVARRAVDSLKLARTSQPGAPRSVVAAPRGVQTALLDDPPPPGLVIVEAPMGEGKTEASWILAEQWREHGYSGAYMALPTQATSDSLFARYRDDYLARLGHAGQPRLVHGMAWLRDDLEPEGRPELSGDSHDPDLAAAWFRPTRRALLAEHGVGTVDQCLLAAMKVRFGFLRLYGLHRRVLVVDEVHAYDAYMSAILQRLLEWCAALDVPVVLLSATLSAAHRADLLSAYSGAACAPEPDAPYPLITSCAPGGAPRSMRAPAAESRRLRIRPHAGALGDPAAAARLAEKLTGSGGCACVIVNTVRQAQAVYREVRLPDQDKTLFHARFTAERREAIAERVTGWFGRDTSRRPSRHVVVATQVAEQSLDVDFDSMVTEIAPVDLLLQRSGRMHRHQRRNHEPELHVLMPDGERPTFAASERIYDRYILLRTLAILRDRDVVVLPNDFRELIEACYGHGPIAAGVVPAPELERARKDWADANDEMASMAGQFKMPQPSPRAFRPPTNDPVGDDSDDGSGWRAQTRLGARDLTCLLLRVDEADRLARADLSRDQVRSLYRRALRIPHYLRVEQPDDGFRAAVAGSGALRGVCILPVNDAGFWRGGGYSVRYDETYGLTVERTE